MKTKTFSLFALCLLFGAVMLACGGGATDNAANTSNTAGGTTASGDKVGVAECDEYIQKYEACVSGKVPEATRATYTTSLETMRSRWQKGAETLLGEAALARGCEQALEQANTNMGSFGWSW